MFRDGDASDDEAAFLACTVWMVEPYALLGEPDSGERMMREAFDATG